jgi:hypothetical protein
LPRRRSAEPSMKRGGPRSSTCHNCSSPFRTTSPSQLHHQPCSTSTPKSPTSLWY